MLEAWIDVGGTFTDCFVKTDSGELLQQKVLSSGRVPIANASQSSGVRGSIAWAAAELMHDADDFWVGGELVILSADGVELSRHDVVRFTGGKIELDSELAIPATARLELDSGLHAPVLAVRRLLGCILADRLQPIDVRLGTTRGTNALLTRSGERTTLAITDSLRDLLEIGDQTRPDLFALNIQKHAPLNERTIGVKERLNATGKIKTPLDETATRRQLEAALKAGSRSLAICLMHSYKNDVHELAVERIAREVGFAFVSVSSQLAPLIEIVPRAQTTVVDAYLSPTIRTYLAEIAEQFSSAGTSGGRLSVMTSAGGLVDWQDYSGKDCILSGPAGGVVALQALASAITDPQSDAGQSARDLIGIDMGGTSTDVCQAGQRQQLDYESTKAGVRILTPTLPIETIASGGGSICWFDGVSLRVGPESGGSTPGPAAYGRGGPLTITDINIYLGLLPAEQFPFPIEHDAIASRLQSMEEQIAASTSPGDSYGDAAQIARGFRTIACQQMSEAVRSVAASTGADVRQHALVGFGGAAGQHVCEVAELLGMQTIYDTPQAGLWSALGMGLASARHDTAVPYYEPIDAISSAEIYKRIEEAAEKLRRQFASTSAVRVAGVAQVRYAGTDATLAVGLPGCNTAAACTWDPARVRQAFESLHHERFGYARPNHTVELVSIRLTATEFPTHQLPASKVVDGDELDPAMDSSRAGNSAGQLRVLARKAIRPGDTFSGPLIVANSGSTLLVNADWNGSCRSDGTIELNRVASAEKQSQGRANQLAQEQSIDPVIRDCYSQRLKSIAVQMGITLQQTAISVNVKQRRDYSCAVFDSTGNMLSSAPHVPVHLGAMGATVRGFIAEFDDLAPGDVFVTNDPLRGGSHLPDVTVVTPVFDSTSKLRFFVASRAHHADIGGVAPGSMSPKAKNLAEEGVLIPPMRMSRGDGIATSQESEAQDSDLEALLGNAPWPPRRPDELLCDLDAQRAAGQHGATLLSEFATSEGWSKLTHYCEAILWSGEQRVRNYFEESGQPRLPARAVDSLDDGTPIAVAISAGRKDPDSAGPALLIDFSGSGPVSPANFNANPSIVSAAVMYVLRVMIADNVPLNEGVLRCLEINVPTGVLNPPRHDDPAACAAVAAGNVETSQRIVDVLMTALGVSAASQGTMNNLLFGNERFGFYETICGGAGATEVADGADAVHTHMTNTRLTDPEVLEARYPVELVSFEVRRGSGGAGSYRGGDGVVRQVKFLEDVELSLITSRRIGAGPPGMSGGSSGKLGVNTLIRRDGTEITLASSCSQQLKSGDQVRICTPGGGGFGEPQN